MARFDSAYFATSPLAPSDGSADDLERCADAIVGIRFFSSSVLLAASIRARVSADTKRGPRFPASRRRFRIA